MKVAFVSSEAVPFAKTGGLADVAGALPKALERAGCEVKLFLPKYSVIDENSNKLYYINLTDDINIRINNILRPVKLYQSVLPDSNIEVNLISCPYYFSRSSIYTNDLDEDERFILFSKGVIEVLQRLKWTPDIIHCNDWQTGMIPLFIKDNYKWDKMFSNIATLFTIHNIGYQGRVTQRALSSGEINRKYFYPGGPVEYFDDVSFLKTGIVFSEIINTVSNTYAHEILTPELGAGMEGVLKTRQDDLYGILNGIDYTVWDPEHDKLIPFRYSKNYLTGKLKNKKSLLENLNLPFDEKIPLIGIISRMVSQKGFDIFTDVINDLMELEAQWVVLGNGQLEYENLFRAMAQTRPEKLTAYIGFNNELSHQIEAGADIFLMPSYYEPCGLNQMFSLRYGTVPVVRKTGGLADTVRDWHEMKRKKSEEGTGFTFSRYKGTEMLKALQRAIKTFKDKDTWKKIQLNGMNQDYSWEHSAKEYIKLYEKAVKKRRDKTI